MRGYLGSERRGDRLLLFGTEDTGGCLAATGERLVLLASAALALEGFEGLSAGVVTANASSFEPRSAAAGCGISLCARLTEIRVKQKRGGTLPECSQSSSSSSI